MTCRFYGEDCIIAADAFESALKERGYGELQHPIYGVHKVVPTGTIKRSDNIVNELNVSTVEITFSETLIDETFPDSKILDQDTIVKSMDSFMDAGAAEFAKDMVPGNISESIRNQNTLKDISTTISDGIVDIAKESTSVYSSFQQVQSGLGSAISNLVENPLAVAQEILFLTKVPSRLCINVFKKIEGYAVAITDIINDYKNDRFGINAAKDAFVCARLALQGLISSLASGVALAMTGDGVIDSPANENSAAVTDIQSNPSTFKSREEAINAADMILGLYDKVVEFLDNKTDEDYIVETGEGFSAMRDVVVTSVHMIISQSFNLDTRKIVKLGRDRQIVELLYEIYGDISRIDEFIVDNKLDYNEIQLIPMGREIAYYV